MATADRILPADGAAGTDSYRRLADVFHGVLSEHDLDALLEGIAGAFDELIPNDGLTIYEAADVDRVLHPRLTRASWAKGVSSSRIYFGEGLAGWAAENREPALTNDAPHDPRVPQIHVGPDAPKALIAIPLIARGEVKGVLAVERYGENVSFSNEEFELARAFGDAAAIAVDGVHSRTTAERLAHRDALTGLYNHRFFHERLRGELKRASRAQDAVAMLMLDIDDFKRINDAFGHAVGDQILGSVADMLQEMVRESDIPCRIGGEEFAIVLPSCDAGDALGLARRFMDRLRALDFDPVGGVTVSIGIAQGPDHAMNPRDLVACAEAAMTAVKTRGKDGVLVYEEGKTPRAVDAPRDTEVRSIAHLKMLQSLSAKLNRLNEVQQIAFAIAVELKTLIDYHECRIYAVDGDYLVPISVRGEASYTEMDSQALSCRIGEGITGRAASSRKSLLITNALDCDYAITIPGTDDIEESIIAVPMSYGPRVLGVVVISKLGVSQFDDDDVRLLEVLAGHASVALENARLYEAQRREAESAKALLEFAENLSQAPSPYAIADQTVRSAAQLLESGRSSLWLKHDLTGDFRCVAHFGYVGDPAAEPVIRAGISKDEGERFLQGRKLPFAVRAAEVPDHFELPTGAVPTDSAFAPLHGIAGWIVVSNSEERRPRFTEQRLRLLAGISYQTSVAIQKADLYRKQKENAEVAGALLDFGRELISADGMDEILARIVERSAQILGSPNTVVWLEDPGSGFMRPAAAWGFEGMDETRLMEARISREVATRFSEDGEPFIVRPEDLKEIEGAPDLLNKSMFAVAPVRLDGSRLGFLVAAAPALGDYEFSKRKMRLLAGIAHQAALAINSGTSFESLERTFLDTVEALANALEARDEYTSSHARWISDTAIEVGKALNIDGASLKRLELGALFHDIGKIGIPNDILQKPGRLSQEEWAIMKTHPEMGEKILEPIERLADVRPIVRACHEHYDGSGYPDGLSGSEIPIESRIILVVDAFHAMTTDRPYRKGMAFEEACRRLREAAGTQFDPEVVDALLLLFDERPALAHAG